MIWGKYPPTTVPSTLLLWADACLRHNGMYAGRSIGFVIARTEIPNSVVSYISSKYHAGVTLASLAVAEKIAR